MNLKFSFFKVFLLVANFKFVKLVPDEICLSPLNTSDCGTPPTAVFYYYKAGSRCEIDYWRGCPTENMFQNEYHCSHHCIGRTKFYGRERGSWKGRIRFSIEDLDLNELKELNRILHKINGSLIDDGPKKKLKSSKVTRRGPKITTVKNDGNTDRTDGNTDTVYSNEDHDSGEVLEVKVIEDMTQLPITGTTS